VSEIVEAHPPQSCLLQTPAKHPVGSRGRLKRLSVGLDSFGKPETFAKVFKKLVESYALDAIDWSETEGASKTLRSKVTKFLAVAKAASVENRPSVGLGTDFRLESRNLNGFALVHEDQVLHLSVFARGNDHREEPSRSRMQRFSSRRRYR